MLNSVIFSIGFFFYRRRAWLSVHYNTQIWWRQQLTYIPWLICTGIGNIFYGFACARVKT